MVCMVCMAIERGYTRASIIPCLIAVCENAIKVIEAFSFQLKSFDNSYLIDSALIS